MTTRRILVALLAAFLLVGCSKKDILTPTPLFAEAVITLPRGTSISPTLTITATFKVLPTNTTTPTPLNSSPASPGPIFMSTPTATSHPNTHTVERCLSIAPTLSPQVSVTGMLVLGNEWWNLSTGEKSPITGDENHSVNNIHVSPNGQWMAYEQGDSLVIATVRGIVKVHPLDPDWSTYRWLGNNRLGIDQSPQPYTSTIVLNPFTGEIERELTIEDPSIFIERVRVIDAGEGTSVHSRVHVYYDPTLTRVIYFRVGASGGTVLKELETGEYLAQLPNILNVTSGGISELSYPVWLPNGQAFLTEAGVGEYTPDNRELYSVTRDGQITRLTYFTEAFEQVRVQRYSRSPDGRYIAFWLWTNVHEEHRLAVLDMTTGMVVDTCIAGGTLSAAPPGAVIWSPDDHQFVYEYNDQVILVDIDLGVAARIVENMRPEGWMVAP